MSGVLHFQPMCLVGKSCLGKFFIDHETHMDVLESPSWVDQHVVAVVHVAAATSP